MTTDRLTQLPVLVRPRPRETVTSYICRLARANHLKPSYLHGVLSDSANWFGTPRLEHLAVLTGRSADALARTLTNTQAPQRRRRSPGLRQPAKRTDKTTLYRRIRESDAEGLSLRAIARQHNVGWTTIRRALASPDPPRRKPLPRRSTVLDAVAHIVDELINQDRTPTDIWKTLLDEHNTFIPYGRIRAYVRANTTA